MQQVLTQTQTQRMEQQLRLSMQQLQLVKLLEMPIAEFEQAVKKEMMENPALEEGGSSCDDDRGGDEPTDGGFGDEGDANDTGLDPYGEPEEGEGGDLPAYGDDDLPVYGAASAAVERADVPIGDSGSFLGYLEGQMMNYDLSDDDERVLRYLIGSLDNNGFIDRPMQAIVDELAFNEYIYVSETDVERVLRVLQNFDPAGIGARSNQECLLLQIDRQMADDCEPVSELRRKVLGMERTIIADHYDLFINRNKERLRSRLGLTAVQVDALFDDIKKLNVNPGLALSESAGAQVQTRIPDFIVETEPGSGEVQMRLNSGEVPRMHVGREYLQQARMLQQHPDRLTRREKEGLMYARQKVEAAQMFIESVKQRRRTLYETMRAIIELQHTFFITKDEDDKARLVLADVARRAGYDTSTVSRVCNSKCALVDGRIYPLSDFFKLTRKNASGNEVDGRVVREMIRDIVDGEDKHAPYTDDQIAEMMKRQGQNLARRTIAKYRAEMGIPAVNNRKA